MEFLQRTMPKTTGSSPRNLRPARAVLQPARLQELYPHDYQGPPSIGQYRRVTETPERCSTAAIMSAALHSMCVHYLGTVLERWMRWSYGMIPCSSSTPITAFLLGEHDWWAKCAQPFYTKWRIPRSLYGIALRRAAASAGRAWYKPSTCPPRCSTTSLSRVPPDMQGLPLRATLAADSPVREAGLFGLRRARRL